MGSNNLDIKKISSYYLVGTLFNKGIGFITVPIFTRILSVSDYGIVTTYNSWTVILSVIMSLALYMAVRSAFTDYTESIDDFLSVIFTFTLIYGVVFSIFIIVIAYILPISINISFIVLCLIQSLASALIESASMFFMMSYKYKSRTAIMILPNFISTIIAIIVIKLYMSNNLYFGRIIPNVIVTFIVGVIVYIYVISASKARFNREYIRYALKISLPLILHGIALNILSQSDRTMISLIRNTTENGIYGLIYNFSMIATVITTAFEGIWIPYFLKKMKEEAYSDINKYCDKYIKLMTVVIIGVVMIAPEVIKLLAPKQYWEGIIIIPPIVISNYLIFLYTLYVGIEHYHKKTVFISANTVIAAASNILLNIFFIKQFGYVGAAYTTLISYIISLVLHYMYARKLNKELFPLIQISIPLFVVLCMAGLFYLFVNIWFARWGIALIILLFILITEKNEIRSLLINRIRKAN